MGQGNINHYNAIRMRARGIGTLQLRMFGLDTDPNINLEDVTLVETTGKEIIRLCNVVSQYSALEMKTTVKDEFLRVNRIVFFVKPLFTEYPG